jgi:hypothetical protein
MPDEQLMIEMPIVGLLNLLGSDLRRIEMICADHQILGSFDARLCAKASIKPNIESKSIGSLSISHEISGAISRRHDGSTV